MTEVLTQLSHSLRNPQEKPSDHCYTVLQDHGPGDGGWGPAAVVIPWMDKNPRLFVYTGEEPMVIDVMSAICRGLAQETGKPTVLAKYTQREDVFVA